MHFRIGPILNSYNNGSVEWDGIIEKYYSHSILDFLRDEKWSDELIEGFAKYGIGLGASEAILEDSFIDILRLFIVHNYDDNNLQLLLEGGMQSFINSFLFDDQIPLSSVIKYGYKVNSIVHSSDGHYIVSSNCSSSLEGEVCPTHKCDYVVVTVPLPQLGPIIFEPPLCDELKDAIKDVRYVQTSKLFLQTKSQFWLRHGVDGVMISDLTALQNVHFSPAFSAGSKGMITCSYASKNQAENFFALSEDEKVSFAVEQLKQVFPEVEQEFEQGAVLECKRGYCSFQLWAQKCYRTLRDEALPGIFLAGDNTSSLEHAYVEGCLESGLRAAAGIFCSIDEDFLPQSKKIAADTTTDTRKRKEDVIDKSQISDIDRSYTTAMHPFFRPQRFLVQPKIPIILKRLDHYTLICSNAEEVAEFHTNALHFTFDSIKPINTGTVPEGEHDMLNYILHPPGNKDMVMVVTEGLNDETIFRKYMKAHGSGIHHLAFEVDDLDSVFDAVKEAGIQTTSNRVTRDVISGLKQFFIAPSHAGFFIELIERPAKEDVQNNSYTSKSKEYFSNSNMADLAHSITKFINPQENAQLLSEFLDCDKDEEKKQDSVIRDVVIEAMDEVTVGKIAAIEIAVEDISLSASFLTEILNFRFIQHTGNKVFLALPGKNQDATIILSQARSTIEERKATVMFNSPNLNRQKMKSMSQANFIEATEAGVEGIAFGDELTTTYKVFLASQGDISMMNQVVRSYPSVFELKVHIKAAKDKLVSFLANPANLRVWTGHQTVHFSPRKKCWVETRMDSSRTLTDFTLEVKVKEGSRVYFHWPQRNIEIMFHCAEIAPGCCSASVNLPSIMGEKALVDMKRIISIELDLLKSILEGDTHNVIPHRIHQQIQDYHLFSVYGIETEKKFPECAAEEFGFHGEIVTSGTLFDQMSADFAMTITSKPLAVLLPKDVADVEASVKMAKAYGIPLAARGSRVSHSAGGQAQADRGLLIDMSPLSSVEFVHSRTITIDAEKMTVRCEAGAFWDEVIRQTLCHGLMPPVVNDYQYLSVGGTISMGR